MELEGGIRGGMGGEEQRGDVQMDSLAGRTWEAAQVLFEAPCLPLGEQPLPQHGYKLLADSRMSQPWTLAEQAI